MISRYIQYAINTLCYTNSILSVLSLTSCIIMDTVKNGEVHILECVAVKYGYKCVKCYCHMDIMEEEIVVKIVYMAKVDDSRGRESRN